MHKKTKALLQSAVSLLLCISMLIGSTFAWFTDSVTSSGNIITTGKLDLEMYWTDKLDGSNTTWKNVEDAADNTIFNHDNWEPGYTQVRYIKLVNAGNLALKYQLAIEPVGAVGDLADAIRVYSADNGTVVDDYADLASLSSHGVLRDVLAHGVGATVPEGNLQPNGEVIVTLAMSMDTAAGNEYQSKDAGAFTVKALATQYASESDSFGADYDSGAQYDYGSSSSGGGISTTTASVSVVPTDDDKVPTGGAAINGTGASAAVPEGVQLNSGTTKLTLSIAPMANSAADVDVDENEVLIPVDVHIEGVAEDNTVPIIISIKEALPVGLNMGNFRLVHVEDGVTNTMTSVASLEDVAAHNDFYYDPATGDVTVAMATFSEVALVADTVNAWNGTVATAFAGGEGTEENPYLIANADQLVYFGDLISNDNENYGGKHYKLIADINLGGDENANKGILFYPIGYHKEGGTIATLSDDDAPEFLYFDEDPDYARGSSVNAIADESTTWYTYGGSFKGTFDGAGHKICNIYQNTWQLKGNYSGNYWNAAMGLFGYVNDGTVKNLTVDNFSSDGEFTPTGVIAAYAANSTFENIAITNCNPRVYNTGNGGIVGIGGNSEDPDSYKLTFTNITIDNTNKISALWGSWDVACGGLVGMFRGAGHVYMTNCHVAAQIDVFNDVCGNYQYYWYRYAGMMVGTNKNMTTDANGYTVPETSKFHATGCTVHFGEWNDYYYCELVANSLASYTHDHQFSRLEQIDSLDEIKSGDTWTKSGNFLLISGDTKTCYHIVNKNGTLTQHLHTDAGEEMVNGETVLKEDKQIVYLPFNQLFTGYGWGVKHIPVYNGEDYAFDGITILDREVADSVEKFEGKVGTLTNNRIYKLGDIFSLIEDSGVELMPNALTVTVTNLDENNPVSATFERNANNWADGTLAFTGTGDVQITIQDYYFCKPTTIEVTVTERQPEVKFDVVMNNGNFLHRVGNSGTVPLDKLFKAKDGVSVGTVSVTVEPLNGTASGTYSNNAIQFSGTGVVKVTIQDYNYCTPTELYLEVVDAVNATTATSATKNNVVLLNDCGFSSVEVSGGYTLYGNGFTMTCGSDSAALDMGYSFVTLNNGTLDNVQIVCPDFDYAVLYSSNMTESGNRKETTDKTRYFNVKSGVMASGNSQILNSRISGGRAAVNVSGGNCVIDNSRVELGAVASVLVGAANSLTLRDVTLVQKPTASTYDSSKTLMGFSVLFVCDANGDAAPVTLEGTLNQYAWIDENDKQYVPSAGQSIISTVLAKTEYLHDIDGDGKNESLNLGFAYMPESLASKVNTTTITDNRTNKNDVPYDYAEVSILNGKTYVYSYKNTNGTADSFKTESAYAPNTQSDNITVTYSDTADGLTTGKSFGMDGWVYELNVDLDKLSGYALDFSKLSMSVNGVAVTDFKVNGNAKPDSPVAVTAGGTTYTLTATIDGKEYTAAYKVTGTETSKESPSLVASNYEAGLCVASSYGGTWHGAAPALEGIQIKYWSVAEKQYKTINLSDYTPTTAGKQNGTNTTWTYSPANGDFTLTLTGGQVHSKNNVYAMPVVCDGKLYFVAASSNGLVNSGNSARTIPVSYSFKDNNNGDVLTFSHTWSVAENKDAQYKYSDFCNGTLTKLEGSSGGTSPCVTPDTLVTLADGTQKRIDQVTYSDTLLAWDFFKGEYAAVPAAIVFDHGYDYNTVIKLNLSDGTAVKVVNLHQFFDADLKKFVSIDANSVADYVGHEFVKQGGSGYKMVTLESYDVSEEYVEAWGIISAAHYNILVEGMISTDFMVEDYDLFNYFEVGRNMKFNKWKMRADIAKYGLYSYEDFADYLTYEQFNAFNVQYFKIPVGQGKYTYEGILALIDEYLNS